MENENKKLVNICNGFKGLKKVELFIKGHADSVGKSEEEFSLSLHRAEFIRDFFIKENPDIRFIFKIASYGSTNMVYIGNEIEKRYLNRRVEIELLNFEK